MTYVKEAFGTMDCSILESKFGITAFEVDAIMSECLSKGGPEVRLKIKSTPCAVKHLCDIYTITDAILFKSLPPAVNGVLSIESQILKKKAIELKWPKVSGCYTVIPKEENFSKIIGYSALKNQFDNNLIFPCKFPSLFQKRDNDTK